MGDPFLLCTLGMRVCMCVCVSTIACVDQGLPQSLGGLGRGLASCGIMNKSPFTVKKCLLLVALHYFVRQVDFFHLLVNKINVDSSWFCF